MFTLCESMKWAHLPEPGGLYAQDHDLLVGFMYIFSKRAEFQEKEDRAREAKSRASMGGRGRVAGHRSR